MQDAKKSYYVEKGDLYLRRFDSLLSTSQEVFNLTKKITIEELEKKGHTNGVLPLVREAIYIRDFEPYPPYNKAIAAGVAAFRQKNPKATLEFRDSIFTALEPGIRTLVLAKKVTPCMPDVGFSFLEKQATTVYSGELYEKPITIKWLYGVKSDLDPYCYGLFFIDRGGDKFRVLVSTRAAERVQNALNAGEVLKLKTCNWNKSSKYSRLDGQGMMNEFHLSFRDVVHIKCIFRSLKQAYFCEDF